MRPSPPSPWKRALGIAGALALAIGVPLLLLVAALWLELWEDALLEEDAAPDGPPAAAEG